MSSPARAPARFRSRILGATGASLAGLVLAWAGPWRPAPSFDFRPPPIPPQLADLAVACVGAGETSPAVGELDDAELDDVLEILARLIASYERRDFDSYLALRRGDLAHAERVQRELGEELRGICEELGVPRAAAPEGWVELLGTYWSRYYEHEPPVQCFQPELSRVALHREGLGTRTLADWEAEFEARCASGKGALLEHAMMIPHRRAIELVAQDSGPLRWLDLELGYVAHDAVSGRLVARFVWDGRAEEWFLHRATTILDGELRDDRRYLVL